MNNLAILNSDWALRGWDDLPHALVNMEDGRVIPLNSDEYHVSKACNGKSNFRSFAFLAKHISILKLLVKKNIVRYCSDKETLDDIQIYRKAPNPRIYGVLWSITGKCNLNCMHCYLGDKYRTYEFSDENILEIINQFKEANINTVSITGGEPFLRKDINNIIYSLKKEKFRVPLIMTNALLIDDNHLRFFKEIKLKTTFQVSFDGFGLHNEMRRNKNAETLIVEKLKFIKSHGYDLIISTSISKYDEEGLINTYLFLKDLEIKSWRISIPQNTGNWCQQNIKLPNNQITELYHSILDKWLADKMPFMLKIGSFFNSEAIEVYKNNIFPQTKDRFACETLRFQPYLLPDGTLLPCTGYTGSEMQTQMPNILITPLKNSWKELLIREIINIKMQELLQINKDCIECSYLKNCFLGCRANALIETGSLYGKDMISCEAWKSGLADSLYKKCI